MTVARTGFILSIVKLYGRMYVCLTWPW